MKAFKATRRVAFEAQALRADRRQAPRVDSGASRGDRADPRSYVGPSRSFEGGARENSRAPKSDDGRRRQRESDRREDRDPDRKSLSRHPV